MFLILTLIMIQFFKSKIILFKKVLIIEIHKISLLLKPFVYIYIYVHICDESIYTYIDSLLPV